MQRDSYLALVASVVLFLLVALAIAIVVWPQAETASETIRTKRYSDVVSRVVATGCGTQTTGTATIVDYDGERRLLTNKHVVEDATLLRVGGRSSDAEVFVHPEWDLAQLDEAERAEEALNLAYSVTPGQAVTLVGYGHGKFNAVETTVQTLTSGQPFGFDHQVLLLDRRVAPGFSGGAVIDENFELVGIITAVDQTTGLAVALPTVAIVDELDNLQLESSAPVC